MVASADELADRLLVAALGFADIVAIHLGDQLGWYHGLTAGPATPAELVARAGGNERYAREWLEQQAASGFLDLAPDGRFVLPPVVAEAFTAIDSERYRAPLAAMFATAATRLPALIRAYRSGCGVPWVDYGAVMRVAQAAINRPWYESSLAGVLAGLPDIDAVLRRPGARLADIGCGAGWSTIAVARGYPESTVEGWDLDRPSVELAREHAADAGLDGRATFHAADVAGLREAAYDGVLAFECVHDMADPVPVLAAMRRAVRPDGVVVVLDGSVADAFRLPVSDPERLTYAFSLLICLPAGMTPAPAVGTGAVMRIDTFRKYAEQAGFTAIEVRAEEPGDFRLYELR